MGTSGLKFEECRVPEQNLLLPAERAFKAAMEGIDIARAVVGAMCCGMLRSGLETALDYSAQRRVFGRSVADFQGVRWQLAEVATSLEAARLLTYRATQAIDQGEDATVLAAHAKKFASRAALTGLSDCMQAMGANGLLAEYPLGRHLAAAKIAQYIDGTTEIQNVIISRGLFQNRG
jgi:alkylation response protein AidB-like acyl-CoA dehydrogenase